MPRGSIVCCEAAEKLRDRYGPFKTPLRTLAMALANCHRIVAGTTKNKAVYPVTNTADALSYCITIALSRRCAVISVAAWQFTKCHVAVVSH